MFSFSVFSKNNSAGLAGWARMEKCVGCRSSQLGRSSDYLGGSGLGCRQGTTLRGGEFAGIIFTPVKNRDYSTLKTVPNPTSTRITSTHPMKTTHTLGLILLCFISTVLPGCNMLLDEETSKDLDERSQRIETCARMKYMLLALEEYREKNQAFPNHLATSYSWRVDLLDLIKHADNPPPFDKTASWDSPVNRSASDTHVPVFTSYRAAALDTNKTHLVLVVDEGTVFHKTGVLDRDEIGDGASNTAIALEFIDSDIAWSEPRDIDINQAIKLIQSYPQSDGPVIGFADGSIGGISPSASAEEIRAIFSANDGKTAIDFLKP